MAMLHWTILIFTLAYHSTAIHSTPLPATLSSDHKPSEKIRDVMVVLPVMQATGIHNDDLSNSNLQRLYTKAPVTAIISELISSDVTTNTNNNVIKQSADKRMDNDVDTIIADQKQLSKANDFPSDTNSPSKSPFDYGYPETLKFVQELNDLPKNHKPHWTVIDQEDKIAESAGNQTKKDPFQMFESVKPIDINKMLSLKPSISIFTENIGEEESPSLIPKTKPAEMKTKEKKPTKKLPNTPEKTTYFPSIASKPSTDFDDEIIDLELVNSQMTNQFLPTPYRPPAPLEKLSTLVRYATPEIPETSETTPMVVKMTDFSPSTIEPTSFDHSTTFTPTTSTTTTTTTPSPTNDPSTTQAQTTHPPVSSPEDAGFNPEIPSSNLLSLSKIFGENFDSLNNVVPHTVSPPGSGLIFPPQPARTGSFSPPSTPIPTMSTMSFFPEDSMSPEMKNMLISLGIIRPDNESSIMPLSSTTPTTISAEASLKTLYKKDPPPPSIDVSSYLSFKKLPPIGPDKPSDDMKDLLSAFGLITPPLRRSSRQNKQFQNNSEFVTLKSQTLELPEELEKTLETLGLAISNTSHFKKANSDILATDPSTSTTDPQTNLTKEENVTYDLHSSFQVYKNAPLAPLNENVPSDSDSSSSSLSTDDGNTKENVTSDLHSTFLAYKNTPITLNEENLQPSSHLQITSGPDPLTDDDLKTFLENSKNEVKRQSNDSSTSTQTTTLSSTTVGTSETSSSPSTTDSSISTSSSSGSSTTASSNADLLKDSFGGAEVASEAPKDEDLPPKRPNGLYFYVDWNSFLNVGEESDKKAVRLRFSPRAGNSRNFLNITFPD